MRHLPRRATYRDWSHAKRDMHVAGSQPRGQSHLICFKLMSQELDVELQGLVFALLDFSLAFPTTSPFLPFEMTMYVLFH